MSDLIPVCADLEKAGFDSQRTTEETWEAFLSAGAFKEGEFAFASGVQSTLKVDAEMLYRHRRQFDVLLGHFATFPCIKDADLLLDPPEGWRDFMTILGYELKIPVIHPRRAPGSKKSEYKFEFRNEEDAEIALSAKRPRIGEDVGTTMGSVFGVRQLLRADQDVHSLVALLRGEVNPIYSIDITHHWLLKKDIPLEKEEFNRRMREGWPDPPEAPLSED
ncbi:MAG TPA: hypothetical protein VMR34_03170 [Candidatus Saccharimonadales bacterium]|nr:hypothetical protein [Candidatus Saccharimonadales bacterium]